jgi:hypothetical protein
MDMLKAKFISILISLVIFIINQGLRIIIKIFSKYERLNSMTDYNLTVGFKITLSMFLNSAIFPLLINKDSNFWYKENGLS